MLFMLCDFLNLEIISILWLIQNLKQMPILMYLKQMPILMYLLKAREESGTTEARSRGSALTEPEQFEKTNADFSGLFVVWQRCLHGPCTHSHLQWAAQGLTAFTFIYKYLRSWFLKGWLLKCWLFYCNIVHLDSFALSWAWPETALDVCPSRVSSFSELFTPANNAHANT